MQRTAGYILPACESITTRISNAQLGMSDLASGYILTCQSHPTSPSVTVDYDA